MGDENVVAAAPTASGKTALAELAICKTLRDGGTALFVAPMRALTNEKESEWERFEALGVGTERMQQALEEAFPSARVARLDRPSGRPRGRSPAEYPAPGRCRG